MRKPQSGTPEWHQHKIAVDTVKNPKKGMFLGGPTADEAKKTLKSKFGYTDVEIAKLEESNKSPKKDTVNRLRLKIRSLVESVLNEDRPTINIGSAKNTLKELSVYVKHLQETLSKFDVATRESEDIEALMNIVSYIEKYYKRLKKDLNYTERLN